ncbi:right-handed parallel beta-helix repeat-containing protein [Kitasatospora sp. NPDC002227]|uniref:right-handed parallel beta-helix repeat-containing protein n=1 Tax=Kitasatospora sp. NPDC002227 TaxID=3154773 RepID=UPI00331B3D3E
MTAAAIAAVTSLTPGLAYAADPAGPAPRALTAPRPAATDGLAAAAADNFRTFSSPASKSVRQQKPATTTELRPHTATGKTIYVTTNVCGAGDGDGSQAKPFCLVQQGVDAAAPGDTVLVSGSDGYFSVPETVTVKTSGISIVGSVNKPQSSANGSSWGKPVLVLNGVSDVTVSHLNLSAGLGPAIEVIGSTRVTLDSNYVQADQAPEAITVDGASSAVTLSRNYVDTGYQGGDQAKTGSYAAVSVAAGAKNVTVAGNLLAAAGVKATDVAGLNVTGNTVQRGCASAVDVEGASTAVSIQNNLFEDEVEGSLLGGWPAYCAGKGIAWAPHVTVSADSAAATTADYNDLVVAGGSATATAPYSWAGTAYPTLAAFQAAVPQAAHDTVDATKLAAAELGPYAMYPIAMGLQAGSAAIGSANPAAPGALSADYWGTTYGATPDRGAVKYLSTNPTLAVAMTVKNTSAFSIQLDAKVTTGPKREWVRVGWGDGSQPSTTPFGGTQDVSVSAAHTFAKTGAYPVTVTVTDVDGNTVSNSVQEVTVGSSFTPYGPTRLLDTRTGGAATVVQPKGTVRLQISGNGAIPSGVTAAVLNLTVTRPSSYGYITAYPDGKTRPLASNVNFGPGQTVPNLSMVRVGANGYVDLYNGSNGTVDLIADITGYFSPTATSGYTPIAPTRLVDTRYGTGTAKGQLTYQNSFSAQIAGAAGGKLPGSGITAVALNVTVTGTKAPGYLTVYPSGTDRPLASNVNFGWNHTIANAVIVPVGADGKIRVYDGGGSTDVVIDVVGYYSPSGVNALVPVTPVRLLDTRSWKYGPVGSGGYVSMPIGSDAPNQPAFVLNTTVTNTWGKGYLTVAPDPNSVWDYDNKQARWPDRPLVSTLNWQPFQTIPNLVQATAGPYGIVDLWNASTANTDLVVDAFGYYEHA